MNIIKLLKECKKEVMNAKNEEEELNAIAPFANLIVNFINELNKNNKERKILLIEEKQYSSILKPNEQICDSYFSPVHFNLDDLDIYKNFFKYIIHEFIYNEQNEITFENLILALQKFIIETFGPFGDWYQLYLYFNSKEKEKVSIKELYKKNTAVCIQRASFAHNLLKLLELDDTIISCELRLREQKKYNYAGHALNVVKFNNSVKIIDFTNYSCEWITLDKNTKSIISLNPTIVELTNEEYVDFINERKKVRYIITKKYDDEKEKYYLTAYITKIFKNSIPDIPSQYQKTLKK